MLIILVRHGKPTVTAKEWISGHEIPDFANRYQAARIASNSLPSQKLKTLAQSAKAVFTSDMPRSIHSAQILEPTVPFVSNHIFREIEFLFHFPINLRLPALAWIITARLLWGLGYAPHYQSQIDAKEQAKQAATFLEQQSREVGSIILVGHGLTNLFIANELIERGWRGPRIPDTKHWGYSTYSV